MGKYETVLLISPNLEDQQREVLLSSLEQSISDTKGNLINMDKWGKRKLAYPVRKFEEGFYVLLFYEAGEETIKELERKMRMNEDVLRFLTVQSQTDEAPGRPTDMEMYSLKNVSSKDKDDISNES